ncbi:hypothetical protein ACKKBF_B14085 [Auxenochlorella protothecoides x Auxenochlorella symbiontica]
MAESGQPEEAGLTSITPDAVPPLKEQAPPADPPGVSPPLPPESDTNGESVPTPPTADAEEVEEEEDPLIVAQREREEAEQALEEAADIHDTDDPALKEFYSDMKEVDRDNEVNRILGAFKLNPYEQLGLRFDASMEVVPRQYRKSSLMVHPDKCAHPMAKTAFEIIGAALKDLKNEDKKATLDFFLNFAKEEVLKAWRKAAKHDAAVRVAATMNAAGTEGVQAAYEGTAQFHEAWKLKAREVLANSEWRRRKLNRRIEEETERAKAEHKQEKAEAKRARDHERRWEKTREGRVGTWRDFASKKPKKSKGGSVALGGLKPPKAKQEDEEKRYIQRPVGEQFRPNQKR